MKNKKHHITLLLILLPLAISAQDQTHVDSLEVKIRFAEEDTSRIRIYLDLASYMSSIELSKSMEYLNEARNIAENKEDAYWIAKCDIQEGAIRLFLGSYNEALENYLRALRYFERMKNEHPRELFAIYNNSGVVYDRLHHYDKALERYFQALNTYTEYKASLDVDESRSLEASINNNIANIYETRGEFENALQYYSKALEAAERRDDLYNLGTIHNNMAKLKYFELKCDDDEARLHWKASIESREKLGDLNGLARTFYVLSSFYMDQNELDSAEYAARRSLEFAQQVGATESQMVAWQYLSIVQERKREFSEALHAFRSFKLFSDSLINIEKVREISNLEKQHEVDSIEQSEKLARQQLRLRFLAIIGFMVVLVGIIGTLYVIQRYNRKRLNMEKKQLENDIETKNKELAVNVMYMLRKNELINTIGKKLLKLKKNALSENQKPIQDIIIELESEVEQEVWKEFEMRFQDVHSDFYTKLREKHPDLSPGEERLCAFLRLNMTSKEIAAVTHQNHTSIEVARTRLRKKLKLTNTDANLITYLAELS